MPDNSKPVLHFFFSSSQLENLRSQFEACGLARHPTLCKLANGEIREYTAIVSTAETVFIYNPDACYLGTGIIYYPETPRAVRFSSIYEQWCPACDQPRPTYRAGPGESNAGQVCCVVCGRTLGAAK